MRRAGIAGAALLLLSVVTACGGTGPVGAAPVATVNGHRIYQKDVLELADAQAAYLKAQKAVAKKDGEDAAVERLDGLLEDYRGLTVSTASMSEVLGSLVEIEILSGVVHDAGEEISQADRDENRKALMEQLKGQKITDTDAFEPLVKVEIERKLLYEKVQALASKTGDYEASLRAAYEANADQLEELCVRLIATQDQPAAQAAYDRIKGGEDFAKVASEVSIDTTSAPNGGDIGCVPRVNIASVFGAAATTAKPGDLLAPADGQGSWLVVQVDDVKMPTFEEARDALTQMVPDTGGAAAQKVLAEAFTSAKVTIDPRFGTWNPDQGTVTPPVDPAPSTTSTIPMPDPSAMDPAGSNPAGS